MTNQKYLEAVKLIKVEALKLINEEITAQEYVAAIDEIRNNGGAF